MPEVTKELEDKLSDLRQIYIDGIEAKFAEILEGWRVMSRTVDGEQRDNTIRRVHSFAGSGGMYGFSAISEAARKLEGKLAEIRESGGLPSEEQRKEGETRIESLGQAIQESRLEVAAATE